MCEIECWVLVDADGNWVVADSQEGAAEKYAEDFTDEGQARRVVKVKLNVPLPKAVEVEATVGEEESGPVAVAVK